MDADVPMDYHGKSFDPANLPTLDTYHMSPHNPANGPILSTWAASDWEPKTPATS